MQIKFDNPNEYIRTQIVDIIETYGPYSEDDINKMIEFVYFFRERQPEIYKAFLGVIYSSYVEQNIFKKREYVGFDTIEELDSVLGDAPALLIEMLDETDIFARKSHMEKREILLKSKNCQKYLAEFNPFYVFDLLEYARELTKEDLICHYYEKYNELQDEAETNREIFSLDSLGDLLFELHSVDIKNYINLAQTILQEGYYSLKWKSLKEIPDVFEEEILSQLESKEFTIYKLAMIAPEFLCSNILRHFIGYNSKSKEEQKELKYKIKNKPI